MDKKIFSLLSSILSSYELGTEFENRARQAIRTIIRKEIFYLGCIVLALISYLIIDKLSMYYGEKELIKKDDNPVISTKPVKTEKENRLVRSIVERMKQKEGRNKNLRNRIEKKDKTRFGKKERKDKKNREAKRYKNVKI